MNIPVNKNGKFEITQDEETIVLNFKQLVELYDLLKDIIPAILEIINNYKK